MNRDEFLKWILNKFGCFNENNVNIWRKDYELVLQEPTIDYDILYTKVVKEWDDTFKAPSTPWIIGAKKDCIPRDDRCQTLREIQRMRETAAPPPADVVAKLEALRKKVKAV